MKTTLLMLVGVIISALFAFLYGLVKGKGNATASVSKETQEAVTDAKNEAKSATAKAQKAAVDSEVIRAAADVITSFKKTTTADAESAKKEEAVSDVVAKLRAMVSGTQEK